MVCRKHIRSKTETASRRPGWVEAGSWCGQLSQESEPGQWHLNYCFSSLFPYWCWSICLPKTPYLLGPKESQKLSWKKRHLLRSQMGKHIWFTESSITYNARTQSLRSTLYEPIRNLPISSNFIGCTYYVGNSLGEDSIDVLPGNTTGEKITWTKQTDHSEILGGYRNRWWTS